MSQRDVSQWNMSGDAFRQAIVKAPLPILIYAEDGEILELSEGWTRLTGYTPQDLTTLDEWVQKAYGQQSASVLEGINQLFELNKTVDEGEFTIRTKSGKQRVWQFSSSPLGLLADGRRLVMSMAADVTALKASEQKVAQFNQELEQRVAQRTAQLEAANRELEAFTYTVSHDLRAPLRAMEGFAKALLEDYAAQLDSVAGDYAKRIIVAATKMDALISDLLAYSRIGRTYVATGPVDIKQIIEQSCHQLEALIQRAQAQIILADNLPVVLGNQHIVGQIFTNLLSNSIKFVAPDRQPVIKIHAEEMPGKIRIWVSDNGLGVAAEHQARIFRVFERLHGDELYPGTGIGLAIVKRGAQKIDAETGVDSTLGQGSRFWIAFTKASK